MVQEPICNGDGDRTARKLNQGRGRGCGTLARAPGTWPLTGTPEDSRLSPAALSYPPAKRRVPPPPPFQAVRPEATDSTVLGTEVPCPAATTARLVQPHRLSWGFQGLLQLSPPWPGPQHLPAHQRLPLRGVTAPTLPGLACSSAWPRDPSLASEA